MKKIILFLFISIIIFGNNTQVIADIKLPRIFSDNMVLQRNIPIKIWGWAKPNEKVSIEYFENDYTIKADASGEWEIELPSQKAGGPYNISISGKNDKIILKNIMIGDIWICSGQSNMYFRTSSAENAYIDINNVNYDKIRLFQIEKDYHHIPKQDLNSGEWLECNSNTVKDFSAVAYFFGRELFREIDVPIGLIHTSWGGSNIQAWMDSETIKSFSNYKNKVIQIENNPKYFDDLLANYEANGGNLLLKAIYELDPCFQENGKMVNSEFLKSNDWDLIKVPGYWENLGLENHDGTVWYKKDFILPHSFQNQDLELNLGWIDDYDFTFFNGKRVGSKTYKGSDRIYNLPKEIVNQENNELLVCVYDSQLKGGFWGPYKSSIKIKNDESLLKIDLQGIWEYKKGISKEIIPIDSLLWNKFPQQRAIPTFLYNAMIAPLVNFPIKGAIWYQGESNTSDAAEYAKLLPAMIKGWRNKWKVGDFPFLIVQLANYGMPNDLPSNSNWAKLRESQLETLNVPNTGLAVTIDIGETMDIHPTNKQDVGKRLALPALNLAYEKDAVSSGPIYDSMEVKDGKVIITFTNVGEGLISKNKFGYLNEFAIAGADKKFAWAKAFVQDNKVIVFNDEIKFPVAVRYAWANNPSEANLYNINGLPASPFRTDNWE